MKKRLFCCAIASFVALSLVGCSAFKHEQSNTESATDSAAVSSSQLNDDVGEIKFTPTEQEHIAQTDDSIMYADNEVLIVVKDGTDFDTVQQLANRYNAEIVGMIEITGDYQLRMPRSNSIEELEKISNTLQSESIVDDAYVNYFTQYETESVKFGKEWESDLQNCEDLNGKSWGVEAIHAPQAWTILEDNKTKVHPVRIGLIDNGFYLPHEDLKDCFVETFYNYNPDEFLSQDEFSEKLKHGTHVAGTMAANPDNQEGICGVYPYGKGNLYGASWTNVKELYTENGISCIAEKCCYAELIVRNVKVINCSYGADSNLVELNHFQNEYKKRASILENFLLKFLDKGYDFVIVQSAGNSSNKQIAKLKCDENSEVILENGQATYDDSGDYTYVYYQNGGLAVKGWYYEGKKIKNLSSDYNDERVLKRGYQDAEYSSFFSLCSNERIKNRVIVVGAIEKDNDNNFVLCDFSNYKDFVDVYAPGKNIYSSVPFKMVGSSLYFYDTMDGTSMAAPHVSGLAASVWAADNRLNGEQLKQIICDTATEKDCFMISIGEKIPEKLQVVNMEEAVRKTLGLEKNIESTEQNNGSILCWVVEKGSDDKISNATVVARSSDTNEIIEQTTTDSNGHFELILPEGKYVLTVTESSGRYEEYTSQVIEVKNQSVNYLDDWIKLTRKTTELSQYLGTGINDFLAKHPDLQKVDTSDGTLEYKNTEIIVSAKPTNKLIDFISICGNSDYSLYGLRYGLLFGEADQHLTQSISYIQDNKADYKYLHLSNSIDISYHADASGRIDSVSVFVNDLIPEPDMSENQNTKPTAEGHTYYDYYGGILENGSTSIIDSNSGSSFRADLSWYDLIDIDQDNEKELITEYDVPGGGEVGRYLVIYKVEGTIISECEPISIYHANSFYLASDGNGIICVGYSGSYWFGRIAMPDYHFTVIDGCSDNEEDYAAYERTLDSYTGVQLQYRPISDLSPLNENAPVSFEF